VLFDHHLSHSIGYGWHAQNPLASTEGVLNDV
jgi:hypothetical protein